MELPPSVTRARQELFREHVYGFDFGSTRPREVREIWGKPTAEQRQGPIVQLLYCTGRRTTLAEWELVAFTFQRGKLRIVTHYEPRSPVPRDLETFRALGEPANEVDALKLGWGHAEGNAQCEAFPYPAEGTRMCLIITGTDRKGDLQYIAATAYDSEAEESAPCGEDTPSEPTARPPHRPWPTKRGARGDAGIAGRRRAPPARTREIS